jgi:signal transduction histidine kinase
LRALPLSLPRIERSPRGPLGGVCSGIAEAAAVDPTIVRLAFAFFTLVGGAGVAAYGAAWLALPVAGQGPVSARRRVLGIAALAAAVLLALHGLGLSGALLSTTSGGRSQPLAPAALIAAIALVFGPWAWRLMREREAERAERIRTGEHAALAARVHDSVLQTLALIQRESDDPRRVATLARRQERELRSWLYPEPDSAAGESLATAIEAAAAEIEELESVRVDIVRTGDAELDERSRELVLAVREAIRNAAAHSGAPDVSVFVDASDGRIAVYVRDRGTGFDPDAVPADRRGIADSIRARMARIGGSATVASTVGRGTEVELRL